MVEDTEEMSRRVGKEKKSNILRHTLNWFNDFFGTGLEELDQGNTSKPASCVIAMTLNNRINPNFDWRVNGSTITIAVDQPINCHAEKTKDTFNKDYQFWGVPVTIGDGYVYDIETKQAKEMEDGREYLITTREQMVTKLPEDVQEFITLFDEGQYEELIIHNTDKERDFCDCPACKKTS